MYAIYTEVTAHLIVLSGITYQFEGSLSLGKIFLSLSLFLSSSLSLSGITYQFEGSKPWKISSLLQDFNDDDFDKVLESYKVVDVVHDECDKIFGVLMLYRR